MFVRKRARSPWENEYTHRPLGSLERVLEPEAVLNDCSQAGSVEDASQAVDTTIAYWEALLQHTRTLRDWGATLKQITATIRGSEGPATRVNRGPLSKRYFIASLLGETT